LHFKEQNNLNLTHRQKTKKLTSSICKKNNKAHDHGTVEEF